MKEHDLLSAFWVSSLACQTCKISLPTASSAGAAQNSQKKEIRSFDGERFLRGLQDVHDGGVMGDGKQEQEFGDGPGAGWEDLVIYVGISQP